MTDQRIVERVVQAVESAQTRTEVLRVTVEILARNCAHFTWTGFYLVDGDELVVGPYIGKPTPHTRIKLGEGICGAAATAKETIIVDDVNADPRYLSCSIETKSEIVVPLMDGARCIGEIDIDSDRPAAFTDKDAQILEDVAKAVVARLRQLPSEVEAIQRKE